MKSFYEMMKIIESSDNIHISEICDYCPWDAEIAVEFETHTSDLTGSSNPRYDSGPRQVDYDSPAGWRILGSLIKYKEDDRGEIFFDEKRMPVIEHEFMNPGVKGENVPEPYRSGSSEVTGFRETMGTFFRGLVGRSGQDVRDFPDSYWQELVG